MRRTLLIAVASTLAVGQEVPSYNRDVRPILADRCFPCHGPDSGSRKASLRLDLRDEATRMRGWRVPAIVPGDPAGSLSMLRIRHATPGKRMPPPSSKLTLSEAEIEILERWIAEGAPYERHWAFVHRENVPDAFAPIGDWALDPLDRYIQAGLGKAGLSPSPAADKTTWLRRVTFDLIGLPPTIAEIDAFLADDSDTAYETVVDRLLVSPHFGERMASDWLDVARYADTFGYQSDVYRDVWPWRDWVVEAFNENLPYDQFLTWQLAGDLLPNATREQRLATAFNRLHRQTNEGGSVEEEYRQEYIGDRVHTMGTAFMGLTLECARCHDHKFDPISQREYYGLAAFFANIDESGLYSHFTRATPTPTLDLPNDQQAMRLAALDQQVRDAETARDALRDGRRQAFAEFAESEEACLTIPDRTAAFSFEKIEKGRLANADDPEKPGGTSDGPKIVDGGVRGKALLLSGENNAHFPGIALVARHDPLTISLWIRVPAKSRDRIVIMHRSRAWTDAASMGHELLIVDGHLRWSMIHFWPGDAISIQATEKVQTERWTHVAVAHDGSATAAGLRLWVDGRRANTHVLKDNLTRTIRGGGGHFTIGQRFRDMGFKGGQVDELQVFSRALHDVEIAAIHAQKPLPVNADDATFAWWLEAVDDEYRKAAAAVTAARKARNELRDRIRNIMVMDELPERRPTRVLHRGLYDQPKGDPVPPHTPAVLPPLRPEGRTDRLALARWLTRKDHPLTARVAVNRLWQIAFGRGLVSSPDNFGTQGVAPSHPDLLDALARDFVESGWDVKAMLRRLVLSSTYRQSGKLNAKGRRIDPENTLLWHGPIKRLTSEMLRDQALSAAGLLVAKLGGPPVKPYQPEGLWKEKSGQTYRRDKGAGLYRRSLYTFWKRTSPPPSMMILDGAKRDVCVPRRHVTNTPLQSLVLLNDPQFVEASRALAARAIHGSNSVEGRIALAFRTLTGRAPRDREAEALHALYQAQLERYEKEPEAATRLLATGDSKAPVEVDPAVVAALANVCSTILSSDAAVTTR